MKRVIITHLHTSQEYGNTTNKTTHTNSTNQTTPQTTTIDSIL